MTKKEIVRKIAEDIHETQLKTKEIVQGVFDSIIHTLLEERRIELRNFGVFEVKLRKRRKARNPRTETPVDVPEKFVVTFKPGKYMEEKVRELKPTPEDLTRLNTPRVSKKAAAAQAAAEAAAATMAATAAQAPAPTPTPQPASGSDANGTPESTPAPKRKRPKKTAQV